MPVVTYDWPVAGLVAPTATQMVKRNTLTADVSIELYDTTITITHNMQLTAAQLAAGFPLVNFEHKSLPSEQERPFVSSRTTNTVVLTVTDFGVGTIVAPMRVTINRPTSSLK